MSNFALPLIAFVGIAAAASQDVVTLKASPAESQEIRYSLKFNLKFNGEDVVFSGDVINRVTDLSPDGSFTMATTQKNAQMTLAGQKVAYPEQQPTFTTYASDGRVTAITGDDITADDYRFSNLTAMLWPAAGVKVGEGWSAEVKSDASTGAVKAACSYRLLAQEELLGRKTNKISFEIKEQEGSRPASAKGVIWTDQSTGLTVKMAAELKDAPIAGTVVDAAIELTLTPNPSVVPTGTTGG